MIDAQPGDGWIVPAAVASALAGDARAADAALAAAEPLWDGTGQCCGGDGPVAARGQVRAGRPGLSRASRECFEAAGDALGRLGARDPIRRRCPTSPSGTYCKTDVRPTTNWRKSHDRASRGTAGDDREGADRGAAADHAAHRQRGRGGPGQTAFAADVAAGLGPGPHRQPGGALAAARGRRARPHAPGDRPAVRRVRAPARRAADAAAAAAGRGAALRPRGPRPGPRPARAGPVREPGGRRPAAARPTGSRSG